jgi:DNA (cytosine-5)-methyltransferase 1
LIAFGGNDTRGAIDIATALNSHGGPHGRLDFESETFVAHSLRAEGFDASEDGTGRGTPLVPCMVKDGDAHSGFRDERGSVQVAFSITPSNSNKDYNAREAEKAQALTGGGNRPSARGGDMVMTLAIRGRGDSHNLETRDDGTANAILTPNGGRAGMGVGAVAILPEGVTIHGTDKTANAASMTDVAGSIRTKPPGSVENSSTTAALHGSAVRRLTPLECCRLQGFPDDYLSSVRINGKPLADGPMYKALGNSMAVPVMAWIGRRIQMVDDL